MKVKFAFPIWHQKLEFLRHFYNRNSTYNNLVFFGLQEGTVGVSEGLFEHLSDFKSLGTEQGSVDPWLDSVSVVS